MFLNTKGIVTFTIKLTFDTFEVTNTRKSYTNQFFKEFVLFFGENLQYYIMEESENEEQLTESGSLQKSDIMNESPDSKYEIINDMMISMTLQDDTTLDHLIEEYYRREYLDHRLFTLQ